MYINKYIYIYIYIYICTHIHKYTHIHTHIHIYIHQQCVTVNHVYSSEGLPQSHSGDMITRSSRAHCFHDCIYIYIYHTKNLLKSMSGKDMGILIFFPRIGKKYSHTLGNLCKLVSHI